MAVSEPIVAEQDLLRTGCGMLDRSERGKLALTGGEAKEFLNGQVSNDVEALEPGRGCYATFLTPKGKMLGDLRVVDLGRELWLDTERCALQELFNMIRRFNVGYDVAVHKRTVQQGLVSLIGPASRPVADATALGEAEHDNVAGELDGVAVRMIATDSGLDLVCNADDTPALSAALESRGAHPVSEAAAEVLRVETGRPRFGVDIGPDTIPQEAGLNERAVSFTKGCYVGQETVARLFHRGRPTRHLRGLALSQPVATGAVLRQGEREVGRVGSVVDSSLHGTIALGLVRREAEPGDVLAAADDGARAEVVELPF